ncbi:Eco57I restriction-modification methylase domain-containing protein [Burkholderia vietnamiensis]|uniref:Eco57I restriction-modification methylase domain-containing protein n=1 Tax=Burkholderia vietnamiensis TaxID=60552 RepID=UPI00158E8D2B|nr:TaqI-like C-terminal specificity domain-containing protein [Burkholderia vietnamiensis]
MSMHHEWLSLIEISGPFLAVPVLKEAFPQGLEELDATKRKRLRQAYDEWREALETDDRRFAELHVAWIDEVLSRGLELDEDGRGDVLKRKDWCAAHLTVTLPEHGVSLSPDFAVVGNGDQLLMLVHAYGQDVDLDATQKLDGWASTPSERMVTLCRATGCRLGLVTNGERWMLVDAPVGAVTTFASWYARIWGQESVTLQAFVHLVGIRRFFVDESERLPALFDRSLKYQDEVTDALGEQVRRAVEVLIQSLDKADQDRDRELLRGVKEAELYEAALTVMMRLVFLLSAEERGLLLLGDERYEANYALSTLRMQLRAESDEILERRWDAWSRLLAVFRAVYGGIEHENLRLPALGGSLFDPDRFPFLEGRARGSDWRTDVAKPLPIDNRTVLLLLEAIQQFQGRTLSYRALDVEQIGYVYEGLLERTVKRTAEVTLELDATKSAQSPWVTLAELESARLDGAARLAELLQQRSGGSASRVRNDLARQVDDALSDRVLTACHGDTALRDRIKPFAHLVRTDPWGYPLVYPAGAFIVTTGSDRRETGTHYTPKSLTEAIVAETLTPIAYVGPAQGTPRADWALKSPAELLDLKICDPAMGSGAFLVQACRWLADRLVEAWAQAEAHGHTVGVDGRVVDADANVETLPRDTEARTIVARRLIAERCLYGVDLNPLAVELAKLSIWLVTLSKGRPFGFLDHNLRCGDSLLGIHRLDQLAQFSMNPTGQGQLRLFGQNVEQAVHEAIELRSRLREMPIRDIRDVEAMAHLDADARRKLEVPECIADAFIGEVFAAGGNGAELERALASLSAHAEQVVGGDKESLVSMLRRAVATLSTDLPRGRPARQPFHWPLEFPEVFASAVPGFDATLGNPPWGASLSEVDTQHLKRTYQNSAYKLINSFKFFIERMDQITANAAGTYSFLVPSSLLEHIGCRDTRAFLLSRSPVMFIDCGDGMFPGVTQSCCFGVLNKHPVTEERPVVLGTFEGYCKPEAIRQGSDWTFKTIQEIKARKNSVLSHGADAKHINSGASVPLVELADVFDSGIDYSRAALGNAVFYSGQVADDPADHKVLRGRNVGKYSLVFEGIWLRNDWRSIQQEHVAVDSKSRLKVNEKAYVVSPKILVRQTGDQIITTVDVDRFFHQKSLLCIIPKAGVSAFFLCAVLNHPKMTEIYRSMTMQSGKVFSQVKKNFLEQLPIPSSFDLGQKERIAGLAERVINAHGQDAGLLAQLENEVAKGFVGGEAVTPQSMSDATQQEEAS